MTQEEIKQEITELEKEKMVLIQNFQYEQAAMIRDKIRQLNEQLEK